jgi:hypothetical protein
MQTRLSESAVRQILDRAIQLDASHAGALDAAALQSIAAEIGVSREAVEQALAEHHSETSEAQPESDFVARWRRRRRIVSVVAAIVAILVVGTTIAILLRSPGESVPAIESPQFPGR